MAKFNIFKITPGENGARNTSEKVKPFTETTHDKGPSVYGYLLSLKATTGFDHIALTDAEAATLAANEAATDKAVADALAAQEATQQAVAKDRIAQLTDPDGYAEAQRQTGAKAEYDALAPHASKEECKQLAAALGIAG